jgi:hypothetical protein
MNNIAILPYIGMHALQIQNVKRNVYKKVSIKELNNEVENNKPQNDIITPVESDNDNPPN